MRLIKMFGLAALAAVAAMAFVGAGSASATSTALCNTHEDPCNNNKTTSIHIINNGVGFLLSDLLDILCLHVLGVGSVGALGSPQSITTSELLFANCGSNAAHNNCTITVNTKPNFILLKTALNLGEISTVGGLVRVQCTVGGIFKIDCEFGPEESYKAVAEGALHSASAGHGMITLNNAPAVKVKGGFPCPSTSTLDGLLEPLSHLFVTS